jgi:hypothetical protein
MNIYTVPTGLFDHFTDSIISQKFVEVHRVKRIPKVDSHLVSSSDVVNMQITVTIHGDD